MCTNEPISKLPKPFALYVLIRKDDGFAAVEGARRAGLLVSLRFVALLDCERGVGKIQRVDSQLAVFRARQIDSHAVALHDFANMSRDVAQHLSKVEVGYRTIGQIEQQFQSLLRLLGGAEVDRIVHRQGDLVGHQRAEADFVERIGVAVDTRDHEAAELTMGRRQGKGANGLQTCLSHNAGGGGKSRFGVESAKGHSFLVPIHPGCYRLLAVDVGRLMIRLPASRPKMPVDLVRGLVELCNAIELYDLPQFVHQDVEQLFRLFRHADGVGDPNQRFVARRRRLVRPGNGDRICSH